MPSNRFTTCYSTGFEFTKRVGSDQWKRHTGKRKKELALAHDGSTNNLINH